MASTDTRDVVNQHGVRASVPADQAERLITAGWSAAPTSKPRTSQQRRPRQRRVELTEE